MKVFDEQHDMFSSEGAPHRRAFGATAPSDASPKSRLRRQRRRSKRDPNQEPVT